MAGILTQQEIDSLLSGKQLDSPAFHNEPPDGEVVPFDFHLPHRLSKRQLQAFKAVHETFAEAFGSHLLSRLQTPVTIKVVGVEQVFYSQYVSSTTKPTCMYVFQFGGSDARAVLELHPSLVLAIIARMLGGTEGDIKPRPITKIEQNISRGIVLRALSDLGKAWTTIVDQSFSFERYETEGDFVQIAPASEIVLVVSFDLVIDDQRYPMNVCFPTFALEDVLTKLQNQSKGKMGSSSEYHEWQELIFRKLESTKIPAICVLGETTLTVQELMDLQPGDVILTNTLSTDDLSVVLGGKTRACGKPGISNGRAAIKVTQVVSDTITYEE